MKTCVIVNQNSGAAALHSQRIAELASACGNCLTVTEAEQFRDSVRATAASGCERIIVAGGDGTVSLAANILASDFPAVELALLPLGTGNDFARSLDIAVNDIERAFAQAVNGTAYALDIGEARWTSDEGESGTLFTNMAHGALSGLVAHDVVDDDKQRWGAFAYWMTALGRLVDAREYPLKVELDEAELDMQAYGALIANGRYVGGGFPAAPHALLQDGLFDVVLIPVLPTLDLVGTGLDLWFGSEQIDERIRVTRTANVRLSGPEPIPFSIDGEAISVHEISFQIRPRALPVVVGENPPALQSNRDLQGELSAS